jgi:tetratricopeptide (TPR) repeat protein
MQNEEEEDLFGDELDADLQAFEKMYEGNSYGYFDSDRVEAILDHLLITNQSKKAKWAAEQAYSHFPFNEVFLLRKAQAMSMLGEVNDAIRILTQLERGGHQSLDLYISLAASFSQLKDGESSVKYFKKAMEQADPEERFEIAIDLAMEYQHQRAYEKAIAVLLEALENGAAMEAVIYELAYCYDQLKRFDESIAWFLKYLDEDPYSYTAWYNLAMAYGKKGDAEKAIWAFDYCIIINDDFTPAYFNMANTLEGLEHYGKAIEYYQKCIDIDGDEGMIFLAMGECYEALGEDEIAYQYYVKATDLIPQLGDAWIGRAIVSESFFQFDTAIVEAQTAIEVAPGVAHYHQTLGLLYEHVDRTEECLMHLSQAYLLDPNDEDIAKDFTRLTATYAPESYLDFLEDHEDLQKYFFAKVAEFYAYWALKRNFEAQSLLHELLILDENAIDVIYFLFPDVLENDDLTQYL